MNKKMCLVLFSLFIFRCDFLFSSEGNILKNFVNAIKDGNLNLVKSIYEKNNIDINEEIEEERPIDFACSFGYCEIVKWFIEKDRDICKDVNSKGMTPLHYAAENGQNDLVIMLVEKHDCDINVANNAKWRPIELAALGNHLDVVKYLIEKRAELTKSEIRHLVKEIKRKTCTKKYLQMILDFEKSKNRCIFAAEKIYAKSIDYDFIHIALYWRNHLSKTKKLRSIVNCFLPSINNSIKSSHLFPHEKNISDYCQVCSNLFKRGKREKKVKNKIIEILRIEKENYPKFYEVIKDKFVEGPFSIYVVQKVLKNFESLKDQKDEKDKQFKILCESDISFED